MLLIKTYSTTAKLTLPMILKVKWYNKNYRFCFLFSEISFFKLNIHQYIVSLEIPVSKNFCHIESGQQNYMANQLTGFYMVQVFTEMFFWINNL